MTGLRSDSRRNHEAILSAAIAVLADTPQASMAEIARASGTGRTTLYRHFPDRQALVDAIYARVIAEAESLLAELLGDPAGDAVAMIETLCVALAGLGDRYRFLSQHDPERRNDPRRNDHQDEPLFRFLRDAQARRTITSELSADWLFDVVVALIIEASGAQTPERDRTLRTTVRRLLAP